MFTQTFLAGASTFPIYFLRLFIPMPIHSILLRSGEIIYPTSRSRRISSKVSVSSNNSNAYFQNKSFLFENNFAFFCHDLQ